MTLTCSRCGSEPKPETSVVVFQMDDRASQEHVCSDCFVTEDANWPWDHILQIDVLEDGAIRVYFPPADESAIEWKRRDRVDGDPIWVATIGPMELTVSVGCEWIWEWSIDTKDEGDVARGTVFAPHDDLDDDDWDYQNVELGQKRCEAAARALLPFMEAPG